ncbi:TonB-dependent receptor [candidate division KSB1 bacterium]|nr:TonB-dependent receptor [candidate division KSB1 bacterium]
MIQKRAVINTLLLIAFLTFVLTASLFSATTGKIKGVVKDASTGTTLPAANLFLLGTNIGTITDLDGRYVITNIPPGAYTLVTNYIGYKKVEVPVRIRVNEELEQNIELDHETISGEEVIITAQAEGQLAAINQQLQSTQIANIVSEARIQELPDFNAAATLSRLPGVSTTQSSGEDNKVVIRGLSPKYNSIEIEGVTLSSTGSSQIGLSSNPNSGGTGVSNDRSVDLTMVSPYMIRMISVYKSLTPDMNANSIGGTVNMELREAPSAHHWSFMWQQGYTAKSNTIGNYRAVVSGSNRFLNDNFGVYGLVNAESYDRNSDNMDASYGIAAEGVDIDPETGYRPVKVNTVTFNRHFETRKRYGANLIMDYKLPAGSVKFVNMLARINSDYTDNRQTINYDAGRMEWQLRLGENVTSQQMHSLKFDYDFGRLTADLSASYTASSNVLDDSPVVNFNQTDALQSGVLRDNKVPEDLTYLLTAFKGDSNVVLRSADLFSNDYQEDRYTYKADFELPFNIGKAAGFFKFGGQIYNQSNKTDQETPYLNFNGSATDPDATGIQANLMRTVKNKFGISTDASGNLTGDTFLNKNSELFDPFLKDKYGAIYYAANPDILTNILNYIIGKPEFDASNTQASSGAQGGWYDGPYQQLTNDYEYKEDYYAAYAMSKINFWDFMVIGGARYEKVESEYFAYNARDMRNPQAQKMYDTTAVKENEFVLPMMQIKYTPLEWLDIRYAYTQTLSRPDYSSLSPKFTVTQNNQIYTGNPDLKPAKAFNHDINFTFHANELGLFTIGGFYKTIENFVYTANYQLDAAQLAGVDTVSHYQIFRGGAPVVTPVINATTGMSDASVFRPLNNPFEATVKGIELDFQHNFWYMPAPFNNMVFGINYARISSETKYPWYDVKVKLEGRKRIPVLIDSSSTGRLIDQPNHILNTYIGYDYKDFSTRLSFLFQDNSARGNGGRYPENDSYTTQYFRIDFSARQKLSFYNSELFLDVSNLNNANTSWIQKSTEGFRGIQNYGLTANLGLRIRY